MPNYPSIERKKLSDIKRHECPPRHRVAATVHVLVASVNQFGVLKPPTFNVRTNRLLSEQSLVEALRIAGADEVDLWCVDIDEQQEQAASFMLNNHLNEFNWEQVAVELKKMVAAGVALPLTGFLESETGPQLPAEWTPELAINQDQATLL